MQVLDEDVCDRFSSSTSLSIIYIHVLCMPALPPYQDCLDDLAREVCFEEHYQAKKELALRAQTPAQKKAKTSHDLYGLPYRKVPDSIFRCENCKQKVSVTKYAPHLENCLYGIGRAARAGRASRNRRGATKGYGSGKKNKRGGDAGGKSNPDESDGWDSFDAEQNYNTADRATVMSRVGRQAVNGVKCNKTGNIKNGSGNKSGNGNGKHCKSKKNSKKNSTGNNHTTQNQHQTSTKTSTNPQSSAGGWGAATTSAMDTSTSVKSKGIGKGSGNAGDEGKKKKRGEKRKRAVRGQGEYWSDPLPADLPTHATRGGYPYACQPDDPAVVNSTAPSVESVSSFFRSFVLSFLIVYAGMRVCALYCRMSPLHCPPPVGIDALMHNYIRPRFYMLHTYISIFVFDIYVYTCIIFTHAYSLKRCLPRCAVFPAALRTVCVCTNEMDARIIRMKNEEFTK